MGERLLPYYPTCVSPYDGGRAIEGKRPWGGPLERHFGLRYKIFAAYNEHPAADTWDKLFFALGGQHARYLRMSIRPGRWNIKVARVSKRKKKVPSQGPHAVVIRRMATGRLAIVRGMVR